MKQAHFSMVIFEFSPLQCHQEHKEYEQLFLCNDLLFLWLLCHFELHKLVEIHQFDPPVRVIIPTIISTGLIKTEVRV
jgi:hypothetical protein